ncbi:MAG: hypothetical protein J6R02_03685 [Alistipes sp.]|jgi:hypothetical protein|nr:hypothetical protein [Alistipes sp.]MBO5855126.1 hypothetical protein [Alistipes sp.]
MGRYIVRSLKYLLFISVLYIALVWLMSVTSYSEKVDMWLLLESQLRSEQGTLLIVAFIALAIFYPRFGFMRRKVEGVDITRDRIRIDNAMRVYGFMFVGMEGETLVYRANGVIKRLSFMYEDRVEVRVVDGGVEIDGIRRAVARIAFQLSAYIDNSRFEDKE